MTTTLFEPRWASAPGSTILDALTNRQLTVDDLADALGLSDPETRRLIRGELPIDASMATVLVSVAGGTERFWLMREEQYRESKRLVSAETLAESMPLAQMVQWGWIDQSASWRERTALALDYFGVQDGSEWQSSYAARISDARYRTSPTFESSEFSVAVWLRQVEIQAESKSAALWSPDRSDDAIASLRAATRIPDPAQFLPIIESLLAEIGIVFLLVRAPKDCAVSGAAFRTATGQRVIAVTGRYRSDDHLFFTILHELGHHLLHDPDLYIDEFEDSDASSGEAEADSFASESLVPGGLSSLAHQAQRPSMRQVVGFAARVGVAPGVVVGQFQHAGVLRPNQLNRLKRRYAWDGVNLRSARSS